MAQAQRFVCRGCGRAIEAWSDGNPYYFDDAGEKRYAYHPRHDLLARCVGNDVPHLCLGCGAAFSVDSRAPITACPECSSGELAPTYEVDGRRCPYCKSGVFETDSGFMCIS
jgi:DNA-directed RNA polymerase subunit RPC12/RpoP